MGAFLHQTLLAGGILVVVGIGPAIGIWFLLRRKAKDRARRRSPLSTELLRSPGESLTDQLIDLDSDVLGWLLMMMVMPLVITCVHLAQSYILGTPESVFRWIVVGLIVVGCIATGVRKLQQMAERKDILRLGLDGERAVGEELNQLMRKGAIVFHDVPGEEFNVDHVVIAREGLFAVETKGYSKPVSNDAKAAARVQYDGARLTFPMFKTSKPLEQADWQAQWLAQWLSKATGSPVTAVPVLALPGWFVDQTGVGPVRVYSGRQLSQLLSSRGTKPLTEQDMQRIAYQVEQRCRNVRPAFTPVDGKAT